VKYQNMKRNAGERARRFSKAVSPTKANKGVRTRPLLDARNSFAAGRESFSHEFSSAKAKAKKWLNWEDNSKWLLLLLLHSGIASLLALLMDYGIEEIEKLHDFITEQV
jgi:hypothetical protein